MDPDRLAAIVVGSICLFLLLLFAIFEYRNRDKDKD